MLLPVEPYMESPGICRLVKSPYVCDEKRPGEIDRIYIDNTKALKELDWSLKVELQGGIRLTTEFYEERRRQLS